MYTHSFNHRRTGPVSFRGAEVSCPNIFSIACPKIKWFCSNITWFFCPNMAIWKIIGGLQPPQPPPPASYAYGFNLQIKSSEGRNHQWLNYLFASSRNLQYCIWIKQTINGLYQHLLKLWAGLSRPTTIGGDPGGTGGRVPPRIFLGGSSPPPPRFLPAWKISIHIFAF